MSQPPFLGTDTSNGGGVSDGDPVPGEETLVGGKVRVVCEVPHTLPSTEGGTYPRTMEVLARCHPAGENVAALIDDRAALSDIREAIMRLDVRARNGLFPLWALPVAGVVSPPTPTADIHSDLHKRSQISRGLVEMSLFVGMAPVEELSPLGQDVEATDVSDTALLTALVLAVPVSEELRHDLELLHVMLTHDEMSLGCDSYFV